MKPLADSPVFTEMIARVSDVPVSYTHLEKDSFFPPACMIEYKK